MIAFAVCFASTGYYLLVLLVRFRRVISQTESAKVRATRPDVARSSTEVKTSEREAVSAATTVDSSFALESSANDASVTVMQPILSGDPDLEQVLSTNVTQNDIAVHWLWLVDADDRDAIEITDRIKSVHTNVSVVRCPAFDGDGNPKIAKLRLGLASVATEYVTILDDDTRLSSSSLRAAIQKLEEFDLCTGVPCYELGRNRWSCLVAHFVNNNSILTYLGSQPVERPLSINGMFYVMRREYLNRFDFFGAIAHEVCDDLALANAVYQKGGRIRQCDAVVYLSTHVGSRERYVRLMHRWMLFASVLVNKQSLGTKVRLAFFLGAPPLALWGALVSALFVFVITGASWWSLGAFCCIVLLLAIRIAMLRWLLNRIAPLHPRLGFWMSLVSELLQSFHWLHALGNRVIIWRTRRFRVGWNGEFVNLSKE